MKQTSTFSGSTRRPLACDYPVEGWGKTIQKELQNDPAGWDGRWGDERGEPKQDFWTGMNGHASGAAKMSRGPGLPGLPGKDPNDISHGRASGRLHYRALDTKISSNERPGQFTNPPSLPSPSRPSVHSNHTMFVIVTSNISLCLVFLG